MELNYQITPFEFKGFKFNSITFNNDIYKNLWFVNREIYDYLGYGNPSQVLRDARLFPNEIMDLQMNVCDVSNTEITSPYARKTQVYTLISESGLYKLIGNSNKSNAIEFQNWVYQVVIPSIRRTHGYIDPVGQQMITADPAYINYIMQENARLQHLQSLTLIMHFIDKTRFPYNTYENMKQFIDRNGQFIDVGRAVFCEDCNMTINELAKLLQNIFPFPFSEHILREHLRTEGFLMRTRLNWNEPTQFSIENGFMKLVKKENVEPTDGYVTYIPVVTPKGLKYFIEFFSRKFNLNDSSNNNSEPNTQM